MLREFDEEGTNMARTQMKMQGYVKWFNTVAGFGAIEIEGQRDVLFNRQSLKAAASTVAEGELVEFDLTEDRQAARAVNVVPLD